MNIGERIASLRKIANMSQKDLAEAMKLSTSAMNRVELGMRPLKDDEVRRLSDIFDISADFLLGRQTRKIPLPVSSELKSFFEVAKKSSPAHLKIATTLLQQLNQQQKDCIKKEPPSNEDG